MAQDIPIIPPTRVDFDATSAPKSCQDKVTFGAILGDWLPNGVVTDDAARRIVVRLRRTNRSTLADVTLVAADGTVVDKHHEPFGAKEECHKILYDTARAVARLLGAFEKPPPKTPMTCPVSPPISSPTCPTCPVCPALVRPAPRMTIAAPATHRFFVGAGVFYGMGLQSGQFPGPQLSLGFVPVQQWPRMRIEFDGAWAPNAASTSTAFRGNMIPFFGSICYAPAGFRLCSGIVSTLFIGKKLDQVSASDDMGLSLAASFRMGAEFEMSDRFSVRLDGFVLLPLGIRGVGPHGAGDELAAGTALMGIGTFD
ncbi:MAG TPA: hypothetical protein PK156_42070 [Polyangium sp.]|nr:hypothetical protein [Polyangium sp.]